MFTKQGWESGQLVFEEKEALLRWQQKFCDNQMYFMLDHQYANFQ